MLSFNPILSQSRATQSLKNPQLSWYSLRSQLSDEVLFPYLQHWYTRKVHIFLGKLKMVWKTHFQSLNI